MALTNPYPTIKSLEAGYGSYYNEKLEAIQKYYREKEQRYMYISSDFAQGVDAQMMYTLQNGQIMMMPTQSNAPPIEKKPKEDDKLRSLIAYYYHRK